VCRYILLLQSVVSRIALGCRDEFYFILTWHIHSYNCANKHFLLCVMLDSCSTLCLRTTRHCVTWDKFLCINNIYHIFGQGYCV
jgi:hypothetical protein